jgi:carbamoyl-phosphate synthase small subunit
MFWETASHSHISGHDITGLYIFVSLNISAITMPFGSGAKKAILLLEDGTFFEGMAAGHPGTATGEICFNTGMTGYQEIFTDPSYFGQILVTTHVHIGNYGARNVEVESRNVQINALVCKSFIDEYSRTMADQSIQDFFEEHNRICIYGVDTRAIVRHIRSRGAMNAIISSEITDIHELKKMLSKVPSMAGLELSSHVTTDTPYEVGETGNGLRVAAIDYGIKSNILRCMVERGCYVKVFPAKATYEEVMSFEPHGIFLSNGPGDPAAMTYTHGVIRQIVDSGKPVFGICLGHQLLALSQGVTTYKMHHGHRGINHPVLNVTTGRAEITSQNHGFGVSPEALAAYKDRIEVTHVNLNDQTVEGIRIKDKPAFSVQYHPESSPGPHDSRYLFDQFITLMKEAG